MAHNLKCARRWRRKVKEDVLSHYGGRCYCCGERDVRLLTLDHKNNDGKQHRLLAGVGFAFYLNLRKAGYPDSGLQAACFNCNMGRALNGGVCPHKQSRHHEFFEDIENARSEDAIDVIMNRAIASRIPPRARSKLYKTAEASRQRLAPSPKG